jgi:hypothetical protein
MRTIIEVPESELAALNTLCAQASISRAEAIRRAIRAYLQHHRTPPRTAFGLWGGGEDGLATQQRLRDEW